MLCTFILRNTASLHSHTISSDINEFLFYNTGLSWRSQLCFILCLNLTYYRNASSYNCYVYAFNPKENAAVKWQQGRQAVLFEV